MARMWRGPTAEARRIYTDPLWTRIANRNHRHGIESRHTDSEHRRSSRCFRVRPIGDAYYQEIPLGHVAASDPWAVELHIGLQFTPLDDELRQMIADYVAWKGGEIADEIGATIAGLDRAVDAFLP